MNSKNIAILVLEDEFLPRQTILNCLKYLGYFKLFEATNAKEALAVCKKENIILSFLDIGLRDSNLDGIDIAKEINRISQSAIIFTTSYSDKSTLDRIKEVNFNEYVLKPVNERRLFVAIELALSKSAKQINESMTSNASSYPFSPNVENIFVKGNTKFYDKIWSDKIIYLKAEQGGVNVVTLEKIHFTYTSLTAFIKNINHPDIIRIHNSHAINKRHVIGKAEGEIKMIDGTILTIGRRLKAEVDKHFLLDRPKSS